MAENYLNYTVFPFLNQYNNTLIMAGCSERSSKVAYLLARISSKPQSNLAISFKQARAATDNSSIGLLLIANKYSAGVEDIRLAILRQISLVLCLLLPKKHDNALNECNFEPELNDWVKNCINSSCFSKNSRP